MGLDLYIYADIKTKDADKVFEIVKRNDATFFYDVPEPCDLPKCIGGLGAFHDQNWMTFPTVMRWYDPEYRRGDARRIVAVLEVLLEHARQVYVETDEWFPMHAYDYIKWVRHA